MNRFITIALVLIATVAVGQCQYNGHYDGPGVQRVSLNSLANVADLSHIEQYLGGGAAHGNYGSIGHYGGHYGSNHYGSNHYAPSSAKSASYSAASSSDNYGSPSYAAPANYDAGYGASAPSYNNNYGPAVAGKLHYSHQLTGGKTNYKTYVSPIKYNTVSLPIVASDPVAKLHVPQHSYSSPSYNSPSYSAPAY